jgi:hypothetical protein
MTPKKSGSGKSVDAHWLETRRWSTLLSSMSFFILIIYVQAFFKDDLLPFFQDYCFIL